MPRRLEILLTAAATALAVLFFASVPHWPKEWTARGAPIIDVAAALKPKSVLAELKPVPDLNLSLPADLATVVRRTGINGETGLIPTTASITTFRLRATGDLVSVAAPTGLEPVRRVPGDDTQPRVRGAFVAVTVDRGNTIIRWTENGVTYEMSSRTLEVDRLVELANTLH